MNAGHPTGSSRTARAIATSLQIMKRLRADAMLYDGWFSLAIALGVVVATGFLVTR